MDGGANFPTTQLLNYAIHRSSVLTAVAVARAAIRADRQTVGTEPGRRLAAPVVGAFVLVVELELVGIRRRRHVHALVTDVQAVDARLQLRRSQMIHVRS